MTEECGRMRIQEGCLLRAIAGLCLIGGVVALSSTADVETTVQTTIGKCLLLLLLLHASFHLFFFFDFLRFASCFSRHDSRASFLLGEITLRVSLFLVKYSGEKIVWMTDHGSNCQRDE